jgi:hypothetical protein
VAEQGQAAQADGEADQQLQAEFQHGGSPGSLQPREGWGCVTDRAMLDR